ncbi:hypothetical protein CCZ01_07055 [Helicobacter monodelphidis]|uniref:cytochrome b/b6 domain-containing protein n=1 Tax=Helicobacter sp. 15-1451 TaxID=2004995 RepID=UPI000DCE8503|nr:cytochrome b/b6 domain-containing protein [Helicobacter sp. 15-1451]RAX57095.1 hypothetical protein CCZ01_07055 [Helicobacter sp. 15-1451]
MKKYIKRQSLQNRIVHWGIAFSTFSLILSGIFQMPVAKRYMVNELPFLAWSGDYHTTLIVHYIGAFFLIFFIFFHLFFHLYRREFDIFPKRGDTLKSIQVIKAMLTGRKEPPSEKYLPEQRLAYFGIGLVLLILIITGLIKTFKNLAGINMPEWLYFWSAQIHNFGMILIILGIIGHLAAFIFRENRNLLGGMFSGRVGADYTLHRHSLWTEGCNEAKKALKKDFNKENPSELGS